MTDHQAVVPPHNLIWSRAGAPVTGIATPGDIGIVRTGDVAGAVIRFGEDVHRLIDHQHGHAWDNHCFAVIDGGCIAQAEGAGVVRTPLAVLQDLEVCIVHPTAATPEQLRAAVDFATWAIGIPYGWPSIGADAIDELGADVALSTGERMVCSTHAARTAERWGYIPAKSPYATTPDDITLDFGASVAPAM